MVVQFITTIFMAFFFNEMRAEAEGIDHLRNSLDDLQFHFTRKPYFDEDEYIQLLDCMTDGGNDMLIYHAQNQSWKALADLWAENGNIIDYNGYY